MRVIEWILTKVFDILEWAVKELRCGKGGPLARSLRLPVALIVLGIFLTPLVIVGLILKGVDSSVRAVRGY